MKIAEGIALKIIIGLIKLLLKRGGELAKMNHLETQEIIEGAVYVIKTRDANFYITRNGDEYIAIDAGDSKNIAKVELGKLDIKPEKITTVLLTHTDLDHVGALGIFKNADIYISKQEVQMIDGSVVRMFDALKNRLNHDYKVLDDNEEIYFGKTKVKCILTPGHTNGSMSYILDDKYLFVGDTLSLKDGQVEMFNSSFNMDDNTQRKSIEKLSELQNIEYVFTAHYGFIDARGEIFGNFQ